MKKGIGLTIIAFLTVFVLIFISNPHLLDKIWMWGIGLAGYLIALFESGYKSLVKAFEPKNETAWAGQKEKDPKLMYQKEDLRLQIKKIERRILQIEQQLKETESLIQPPHLR